MTEVNAGAYWHDSMPIDVYVAQLWRKYRNRFTQNRDRTDISPEIQERFAGRRLRLLVLTEPYCEDSSQFVPVVWRLSLVVDDLELRVLRQSAHPDLAARYRSHAGHPAIPVFMLLTDKFDELGAVVERPEHVNAEIAVEIRSYQDAHPDLPGIRRAFDRMPEETQARVKQHIAGWRNTKQDGWASDLLEELAAMIPVSATSSDQA